MFKKVRTLLTPSGRAPLLAAVAIAVIATILTGARLPRAQATGAVVRMPIFEMEPSTAGGQPLTAAQRSERSRFLAHRLGLDLGVPLGARGRAVDEMRRMELAQPVGSEGSLSSPSWSFIGPLPMKDALANFGGPIPGSTIAKFTAAGRVSAIAADPTTPGRVFVGAAGGGVWMTTNGGATFKPIFDHAPTQAIGAIALDTGTVPPTIYVATGEANNGVDCYYGQGIFKSSNLGVSWTQLAPTTFDHVGFTRLAIVPSHGATPATLFASAGRGFSAGRSDPFVDESNPTKFGLWVSRNGGTTWTQYPATTFGCQLGTGIPCPATDVTIDPANPKNVLVGIEFNDVFRSNDGGVTFHRACLLGPTHCSALNQLDRISLATGTGVAYALAGASTSAAYVGFFQSTNAGLSWAAKNVPTFHNPNGTNIDGKISTNFSQEFYDQTLLVDPSNPAIVVAGLVGLYETANSGVTWSFLPGHGGTHSDQHALAIDHDKNTVYVGNDGGAFKFTISGIKGGIATFTSLNAGLPVGQIQVVGPHPTSNSTLLAGFQDNGTQLDTGTLPWESVETGDGGFASFDPSNPKVAYHTFASVGTSVFYGVSGNGGVTWSFSGFDVSTAGDLGPAFYPPFVPDPKVALRVLLAAHGVYVFDFVHGKIHFQTLQDLTNGCGSGACAIADIEFLPSNDAIAWAIGMNDVNQSSGGITVMNTTEANCPDQPACSAGAGNPGTWNDQTFNLPFDPTKVQATSIAIDPLDATGKTAYLTLSGFKAVTGVRHIFKTANMGATWIPVDTGLPDVPVLKLLVDKRDTTRKTLLVATDIGVFRTTNGGASWAAFNLGVVPAVATFDIEQNKLGTIFIGTHGRGAYQLH